MAIAAGRLLSSQLYNVASRDPMALMAAAGALAASALVAAGIPGFAGRFDCADGRAQAGVSARGHDGPGAVIDAGPF